MAMSGQRGRVSLVDKSSNYVMMSDKYARNLSTNSGARGIKQRDYIESLSPPTRGSPTRTGKRENLERRIAFLEVELQSSEEKVLVLEQTVKDLRSDLSKLVVKAHTKKELREKYAWEGEESTYADMVIKFCKEWLFPRFQFLTKDWMEYSESRKSLSTLVLRYCPIPVEFDWKDLWDRVYAPTIAKKYADMRCNINNEVCKAFGGK